MTKTRAILLLAVLCVLGLPYGQVSAQYAPPSPPPAEAGVPAASLGQPERWMALPAARQVAERLELGRLLSRGQETEIAALPRIVTFSDPHGALDRLDALLLHALRSVPAGARLGTIERFDSETALAPQLDANGVRLADFRGQLFFHNLGDLIDRGPRGVAVYRRTRELTDAKLADFIIGNHDFWMFMNLQGLHLPFYAGFNFYGYGDEFDARYGRVEQVVASRRDTMAEASQADWWARKFAELTLRQDADQKTRWRATQEKVNALFKAMTEGMSRDDVMRFGATPEGLLWNSLRGYDVRVGDVYVGVRAVAGSSLRWWQDLLAAFSLTGAALREDAPRRDLWQGAIQLIANDIIPPLRADIEAALERGEWWVRAFEAINYRNYESPEWWAKDWIFHKDWGTATLKEISPDFKEDRLDGPVSFVNYLRQPILAEMADFFRTNFTLYNQDMYGTVVMHGLLPVDADTGEFVFTYGGQEYRGRGGKAPSVWEGLRRIETDIRDPKKPLAQLHEAFALVNSWYADRTTMAKAIDVARAVNRIGSDRLAEVNGFGRLYLGHVTFLEFISHLTAEQRGERIRGFLIDNRIGLVDHGMSARYGHRGAYISTTPQDGITLIGFEDGQSARPIANPRTLKDPGKDGSKGAPLAEHFGMPTPAFRAQLQSEIAADRRARE
jgi:hypothetical protein